MVDEALRVLHRYSLVDHDRASRYREVRVHQLVQRATRENLVLRANAAALQQAAGPALWNQDEGGHGVEFRHN